MISDWKISPLFLVQFCVVQIYEFQEKLEKLKKAKLWITTKNKKNKYDCADSHYS